MVTVYFAAMLVMAIAAFVLGRSRGQGYALGALSAHSLPGYHAWFVVIAALVPMMAVFVAWSSIGNTLIERSTLAALPEGMIAAEGSDRVLQVATLWREIINVVNGTFAGTPRPEITAAAEAYKSATAINAWGRLIVGIALGAAGLWWGLGRLAPSFRARNWVERVVLVVLMASSAVAILTTIGIVFSVLFETLRFFARYPLLDFLFGLQWSPQIAIRQDQVGQSGAFGAVPLYAGTFLIMFIAMFVAAPVGLFAAIYMAEYAGPRVRASVKPVLEILAGIPTVVFGFFAALTVAPLIRDLGRSMGLDVASESALAAGLVMGVMIIPLVSSLSDDVINSVPQSLRDGSYAMGATKSETIKKVVLPAALPGIVAALMLAISRAIGETMIVVMAAGIGANLSLNPLDAVTTITVQIATLLVGDHEFNSVKTLSAFALGALLFLFTLSVNFIALRIVRKYREQYD